jgi:hypothetical protein
MGKLSRFWSDYKKDTLLVLLLTAFFFGVFVLIPTYSFKPLMSLLN